MTVDRRPAVRLRFDAELRPLLRARHRPQPAPGEVELPADGTSTVAHLVGAVGVPRTEIGRVWTPAGEVDLAHLPQPGERLTLVAVARPQPLPAGERFVLDVHLGTLARRLRLLGVDAGYRNDAADAALVEWANSAEAVLLTRDRGLLQRRALRHGAYVRGERPADQLTEVLGRFAPQLTPWSRCPACNGTLVAVPKEQVAEELPPGTRRTYDTFARCTSCGRLYWHGAHGDHLDAIVAAHERSGAGDARSAETRTNGPSHSGG